MAFRLERNGAAIKEGAVIQLGLGVGHDGFSVDDVFDGLAAPNLDFEGHPLITVVGLALAADATQLR